jgi:5-methylcytosine-specific restriction endonuclease McrA
MELSDGSYRWWTEDGRVIIPRAKRLCSWNGCFLPPKKNGRCDLHPWERYGETWARSEGHEYGDRLPESLKRIVLARDKNKCYLCGSHAFSVDHKIPKFKGGNSSLSNLAAICVTCHGKKSSDEGHEAYRLKLKNQRSERNQIEPNTA